MAIILGQLGIGVYSLPLDAQGSSVRGIHSSATSTSRKTRKSEPGPVAEKRRRVAYLGSGLTFGKVALFGVGGWSADVIADEKVICYGLAVEQLNELAAAHPNIMVTILSNLTRDFSERLRHANEAIRSLE
jgi:CRP-like cAMP-binding protein